MYSGTPDKPVIDLFWGCVYDPAISNGLMSSLGHQRDTNDVSTVTFSLLKSIVNKYWKYLLKSIDIKGS